ncbi:MAG: hypothetical protein AAB408_02105 [Patescibacteria group bacterium]
MTQKTSKTTLSLVVGGIGIAILLIIIAKATTNRSASPSQNNEVKTNLTNRELALSCTTDMATQFHIHTQLDIFVDGIKTTIPANTGVEPTGCMHPLHAHDNSGKIHVESPEKRDFALADFFAVWNATFNREEILGNKTDANHRIRITVNDKEVDTYENTIFRDGERVAIYYEKI